MSELISGREAKLAWAEGVDVQVATGPDKFRTLVSSDNLGIFDCGNYFRLKPRTITINGIGAPSCGVEYKPNTYMFVLNSLDPNEYSKVILDESDEIPAYWWRTEEEIKQVVAVLRIIFGKK